MINMDGIYPTDESASPLSAWVPSCTYFSVSSPFVLLYFPSTYTLSMHHQILQY